MNSQLSISTNINENENEEATNNIILDINDFNKIDIMSDIDILVLEYIETLNADEKKAMIIAKNHLQSSFCIEKSNGFISWKKKNKK